MDMSNLRVYLHKALDSALDNYLASMRENRPTITWRALQSAFEYRWPEETQKFSGNWYDVSDQNSIKQMLVARSESERRAWGRSRGHIVVFVSSGSGADVLGSLYPCAEFLETDDGDYASSIPDPNNPRATLKDGEPLPERFSSSRVQRNDQLFRSIQTGPALRLVVSKEDELSMVEHGLWVGKLRGRI